MKFYFKAKIYKVGINPCVKVPLTISKKMASVKGFIPIAGKIENHSFRQTLVPIKNSGYRLYVNGPMLKGAKVKVGQTVHFEIAQTTAPRPENVTIRKEFSDALKKHKLVSLFNALIPSRRSEIIRYLFRLKSDEALKRNIEKVIKGLASAPLSHPSSAQPPEGRDYGA